MGDYAEHNNFIGVTTSNLRKIANKFFDAPLIDIQQLLYSNINQEQLLGLFLLIKQYNKADFNSKNTIYEFDIKILIILIIGI